MAFAARLLDWLVRCRLNVYKTPYWQFSAERGIYREPQSTPASFPPYPALPYPRSHFPPYFHLYLGRFTVSRIGSCDEPKGWAELAKAAGGFRGCSQSVLGSEAPPPLPHLFLLFPLHRHPFHSVGASVRPGATSSEVD